MEGSRGEKLGLFERGDFLKILTMNSESRNLPTLQQYYTIMFNKSKVQGHSDIYVAESVA